jgi:hypothetical protein
MIRIRTIIAGVAGALAIAVPVSTAGAAVPAVSPTLASPSSVPARVDIAPFQEGAQAAVDGWTAGAHAAVDGWTAGANAALAGWAMGAQGAANGFQAGADALTGLQAQLAAGLPQ